MNITVAGTKGVRQAGGSPRRRIGSVSLSREAGRLLSALEDAGSAARPDPLDDGAVIVARAGSVSLGGGRFTRQAAEELLAADLAVQEGASRLCITPPGRARLRRERGGDPDAFRAQHIEAVAGAGSGAPPLRDAAESPLAWMARRRDRDGRPLIDAVEFEAGERLRRDIDRALMLPRTGAVWEVAKVDGGGPRDPASASDAVVAARQRVRAALAAVGSDLSGLLLDLCGFLKGLERIEAERRWPARSAKVVARIALGRLAEHYGLEREATGPDHARMRLWRMSA